MSKQILFATLLFLYLPILSLGQSRPHPRIYISDDEAFQFKESIGNTPWKHDFISKKVAKLDPFLQYLQNDPKWLLSRLQMNWETKHSEVYLEGVDFAYSSGKAPVPTVRFSGTRDWATDYKRPKLEEVKPYFDDPRGFYLENRKTGAEEWIAPSKTGHMIEKINEEIMSIVADAAFLYWYTGDVKYAELAEPVFRTYMDGMYHRNPPIDLENGSQQYISGLATFEVIHENIVVHLVCTYDFLYKYLKIKNHSFQTSESVFQKWADQILGNGIPDNNWNLFQARFLTYIALVLDDDEAYTNGKGRQYYLDHTFTTSTDRQLSISESLLEYDQATGIWPESASYSLHVITSLLRIITLLDHSSNANELAKYSVVEKAALASFQYLFPNAYSVGFGDSQHKPLPPENFELLMSNYHKYGNQEKEALMSHLLSQMISGKVYERQVSNLFQLFFYKDTLNSKGSYKNTQALEKLVSPTFYAPNVSLFNQRLGSGDQAMMVSTIGSYGNHAHANGVSIELFANNYALGPDMGKGPSYWHPTHRNFYSRFPAHNTVVVDRTSDYAAMRSQHAFRLEHCFPESGQFPDFDKITFSQVSFVEPKTLSDQLRFTALVKSNLPSEKGYVIDVFRSKKQNSGRQIHEYIYHNLGHTLKFFDESGNQLNLEATKDLSAQVAKLKAYDFFTEAKKISSEDPLQALFTIKDEEEADIFMKAWIKGDQQTIYSVKSPKSNAISEGTAPASLIEEPLPTFIISKEKESWQSPFAVVFNPFAKNGDNPIDKVSYSSLEDYPSTQIIDVDLSDGSTRDKIILNESAEDITSHANFSQKGLFSLRRFEANDNDLDFIFLAGMQSFKTEAWEFTARGEAFTASIERTDFGYEIFTDKAIKISFDHRNEGRLPVINLYDENGLVSKREARRSRHDKNKVVVNIEKAYQKVELLITEEITN